MPEAPMPARTPTTQTAQTRTPQTWTPQTRAAQTWSPTHFLLVTLFTYLAAQTALVIAHEFTHSTTAWLLGKSSTPCTVVRGNPITTLGRDEGVPYDRLLPAPGWRFGLLGFAAWVVAETCHHRRSPP